MIMHVLSFLLQKSTLIHIAADGLMVDVIYPCDQLPPHMPEIGTPIRITHLRFKTVPTKCLRGTKHSTIDLYEFENWAQEWQRILEGHFSQL